MLHLGLGIGESMPYLVYGLSFVVAFLCCFYRSEIGVLFMAVLFPVYSIASNALKSGLPFANNIFDMIIVAMFLGWLFQRRDAEEPVLASAPLLLPIAFMVAYTLLSVVIGASNFGGYLSEINMARLAHWKNYMVMPVLYVLAYYNLRERRWQYLLFILLAFSFLAMDIRFRQVFGWVKHTHYMDKSRVAGIMGALGPNELGSFHTIYTLFLMGLFMVDRHLKRRIAYAILIVAGLYPLMYSFSRGAYIGLLLGLFFIALTKKRLLLIPLCLFLLAWKTVVPLAVVERVENSVVAEESRNDTVAISGVEIETAGRTEKWQKAIDYFSENPLVGKGYNTYELLTDWDTHNLYLKTLSEQGVVGFSILIWLYVLAFRSGWRLYRKADEELVKGLGFGFTCAVFGSMVVNFFGDRWTYLQLGGIYWILWALVDQYNARCAHNPGKEVKETFFETLQRSDRKPFGVNAAKDSLDGLEAQP